MSEKRKRPRRLSEEEKQRIWEAYVAGKQQDPKYSLRKLSKDTGATHATAQRVVRTGLDEGWEGCELLEERCPTHKWVKTDPDNPCGVCAAYDIVIADCGNSPEARKTLAEELNLVPQEEVSDLIRVGRDTEDIKPWFIDDVVGTGDMPAESFDIFGTPS